ncbi:hypothetical protein [Streptomyces sp. NPDC048473]
MQHMPDAPSLLPAPWWVLGGGMHDFELQLHRELPMGTHGTGEGRR